jgi:cell division protein FtsI (penicillin-binding protein 3)
MARLSDKVAIVTGGALEIGRAAARGLAQDGASVVACGNDASAEQTAEELRDILAYAVDVGTGINAQIPGYWAAGKTGTAQVAKVNGGGYTNKYDASFIGFAPASRPRVVVACILDEPVTQYGAVAAAPLFRDVTRYALARLRVPPATRPPIPPHAIPAS